jgi:hypothetical protein
LAFFGGGFDGVQTFANVDIFTSTSQAWSIAFLSQSHAILAAPSIGDIVAFGGGATTSFFAVVDLYNVTSNTWFTASLSQAPSALAATASTNKILFGGGANDTSFFILLIYSKFPHHLHCHHLHLLQLPLHLCPHRSLFLDSDFGL